MEEQTMRKSVEILCKQNPVFTPACPNCGELLSIKTETFFATTKYECICSACEANIVFNTDDFADDFERQLRQLGISW